MTQKYLLMAVFIVIIDQIIKHSLNNAVKNYGASFSILTNHPTTLVIISILALIIFIYFFFKSEEKLALSFLIAGTLSNLIDRLFLGYVIDYIHLPYLFTFNLADLSNTIGVIILIIKLWK